MIRQRTFYAKKKADVYHEERFFPAGNYTWTVPAGCESVDVFLVGGGGGSGNVAPGAGGYTKTYKQSTSGYRDGGAISVSPGQNIPITVGAGAQSVYKEEIVGYSGGYSQFKNSSYRANGGGGGQYGDGGYYAGSGFAGSGGSGGAGFYACSAGSDGGDGTGTGDSVANGKGQGHTTRDFGESNGKRNAGGGGNDRWHSSNYANICPPGESDYTEGSGHYAENGDGNRKRVAGGGGYGGGASGATGAVNVPPDYYGPGGDGTVLIRYYSYK